MWGQREGFFIINSSVFMIHERISLWTVWMMLHHILPADRRSRRADGSNLRLSTLRRVGLSDEDEEELLLGALNPQEILISESHLQGEAAVHLPAGEGPGRRQTQVKEAFQFAACKAQGALCHSWQVARVAGCLAAKGVGRGDRAP